MTFLRIPGLLSIAIWIGGCASMSSQSASATPRMAHVVVCWQKHSGDATERKALLDAADTLRSIPGVLNLEVGTMLPSTRPIVDTTWDVMYIIHFADAATMNAYLANPAHLKLKHDVLDPNVRQVKVYDLAEP